MTGLTGMLLGTALGSIALPAVLALPTLGILGGITGVHTGDWIERESHAVVEPSENYYSGMDIPASGEHNLPAEKSS